MDVLRTRLGVMRRPRARLAAQTTLLVLAVATVAHGLLGPQIGPRNLATVLTSVYWRGLLVVALLAAGNLFCAACPLVLSRDVARRLHAPRRRWPRAWRGKWPGLALLVAVLLAYEQFALWESPAATALVIAGYFVAVIAVDTLFTGASFCKHLCPIGQFNFIASTVSPTELQSRDLDVCRGCRTVDCIKGRYSPADPAAAVGTLTAPPPAARQDSRPIHGILPLATGSLQQRGCELGLFMPLKVGNLDCTYCLDCVRACPHDNITLTTRVPAFEWLSTRRRSGIGRILKRVDLAMLAVVFTFGALLSAFAMTSPGIVVEAWLMSATGSLFEGAGLVLLFLVALVGIPLPLLTGTAWLASRGTTGDRSVARAAIAGAFTLVPLGFSVWVAHYGFHLLTGIATIVPVTQSAAIDLIGSPVLGAPAWQWVGMRAGLVFPLQLGCVILGAAGSVALATETARRDTPATSRAAAVPWVLLATVLALAAIWIFSQPMDMRGVSAAG